MASNAYSPWCSISFFIHCTIHDPGVGNPMSLNMRQYTFHVSNSSWVVGGFSHVWIHMVNWSMRAVSG